MPISGYSRNAIVIEDEDDSATADAGDRLDQYSDRSPASMEYLPQPTQNVGDINTLMSPDRAARLLDSAKKRKTHLPPANAPTTGVWDDRRAHMSEHYYGVRNGGDCSSSRSSGSSSLDIGNHRYASSASPAKKRNKARLPAMTPAQSHQERFDDAGNGVVGNEFSPIASATQPNASAVLLPGRASKLAKKRTAQPPAGLLAAQWDGRDACEPYGDIRSSLGSGSGSIVDVVNHAAIPAILSTTQRGPSAFSFPQRAKKHQIQPPSDWPAAGGDTHEPYGDTENVVGSSSGSSIDAVNHTELPPITSTPPPLPPRKKLKTSDPDTNHYTGGPSAYAGLYDDDDANLDSSEASPHASDSSLEITDVHFPASTQADDADWVSSGSEYVPHGAGRNRSVNKRTAASSTTTHTSKSKKSKAPGVKKEVKPKKEPKPKKEAKPKPLKAPKPDPDKPKRLKPDPDGSSSALTTTTTTSSSANRVKWGDAHTDALVACCRGVDATALPSSVYAVLREQINARVGVTRVQVREKCRALRMEFPEIGKVVAAQEAESAKKAVTRKPRVKEEVKMEAKMELKSENEPTVQNEMESEVKEELESVLKEEPDEQGNEEQQQQQLPSTDDASGDAEACNGGGE
ncbi:hypothetical protein HDU90_001330 [Geranomyces variabilis]|nr:hypothetical protein HDU90_001330 [Geranomyces variabilis]